MNPQKNPDRAHQKSDTQAEDVLDSLHALMHSYRACLFRALRDSSYGITPMDARVLHHIDRHPGSTQSDLVAHSGKDKGQVARLITGLRKRELIKVQVDDKDRRSLHLYLTEAGRHIQAEILEQRLEINRTVMQKLNATECKSMLDLVEKLRSGIDSENHKINI